MYVQPAPIAIEKNPELKVRKVYDPALKNYLPPEGRTVSGGVGEIHELYWHRLILGKDVIVRSAEDGEKLQKQAQEDRAAAAQKLKDEKAAADAEAAKEAEKNPVQDPLAPVPLEAKAAAKPAAAVKPAGQNDGAK